MEANGHPGGACWWWQPCLSYLAVPIHLDQPPAPSEADAVTMNACAKKHGHYATAAVMRMCEVSMVGVI